MQMQLFNDENPAVEASARIACSARRDNERLYYNAPIQYTMGVACTRLTPDDAYALHRFGKEAVAETLSLAEQCKGIPIIIFRTSDLPYESSTENERKYGQPDRLAIVTPESLTHERIVFSEKPSKRKR